MKFEIVVKPLPTARHWEVVTGFGYADVSIPPGFDTDGCSVPWGLRWRFKHGGAKFAPAVMHDYLYRTGIVSKDRADRIFLELMLANGVSKHAAYVMYNSVKYCGFLAWNQRRKEQTAKQQRGSNK